MPPPSNLKYNKCHCNNGFTLIELSIVLVIIGLIVGGVLVGQDLIKNAEIRAQIKTLEEYNIATNTFKIKYGALPADIPPAQASNLGFFTYTGTLAGTSLNPGVGCSKWGWGNNDGIISCGESYVFWQHLSQAQLTSGSYGGSVSSGKYINSSSTSWNTLGNMVGAGTTDYYIFMPQTKFNVTYPSIIAYPNNAMSPYNYSNTNSLSFFTFGASPYQMYSMDVKTDDGMPTSGSLRNVISGSPCTVATTPASYDLTTANTNNTRDCAIAVLW